jgi:hypothetical protein
MPAAPDNHDAHDYAERIRGRLPRAAAAGGCRGACRSYGSAVA